MKLFLALARPGQALSAILDCPNMATTLDKATFLEWISDPTYTDIHMEIIRPIMKRYSERLHIVEARCGNLEQENKKIKEELSRLKARAFSDTQAVRNSQVTTVQVQRERNSRLDNLKISGLPETENEDIKEKVKDIIKRGMNIIIQDQELGNIERVGMHKPNTPRPIIVEFKNIWTKRSIYRRRFELKNLPDRIFINEDLDKTTAQLYYSARQAIIQKKLATAYTNDCVLYVKATRSSNAQTITSQEDLNSYVIQHEQKQQSASQAQSQTHVQTQAQQSVGSPQSLPAPVSAVVSYQPQAQAQARQQPQTQPHSPSQLQHHQPPQQQGSQSEQVQNHNTGQQQLQQQWKPTLAAASSLQLFHSIPSLPDDVEHNQEIHGNNSSVISFDSSQNEDEFF